MRKFFLGMACFSTITSSFANIAQPLPLDPITIKALLNAGATINNNKNTICLSLEKMVDGIELLTEAAGLGTAKVTTGLLGGIGGTAIGLGEGLGTTIKALSAAQLKAAGEALNTLGSSTVDISEGDFEQAGKNIVSGFQNTGKNWHKNSLDAFKKGGEDFRDNVEAGFDEGWNTIPL